MEQKEQHLVFGGSQEVWEHASEVLSCPMKFAIYLPPQAKDKKLPVLYWLSGLTCNEQNFITKAGFHRYAAEQGLIVVCPDTSPRGKDIADVDAYDLGQGAGFYVNATEKPWAPHYRMYDYLVDELPALIRKHFPASDKQSICGHSMGGHGALVLALRNPTLYTSVSAFAPIVSPSQVPWGLKALSAYLGEDQATWQQYDAVRLIENGARVRSLLVDQGLADNFYEEQLRTPLLEKACADAGIAADIRYHEGYNHSYYFISSFIAEHIAYHADKLQAA